MTRIHSDIKRGIECPTCEDGRVTTDDKDAQQASCSNCEDAFPAEVKGNKIIVVVLPVCPHGHGQMTAPVHGDPMEPEDPYCEVCGHILGTKEGCDICEDN